MNLPMCFGIQKGWDFFSFVYLFLIVAVFVDASTGSQWSKEWVANEQLKLVHTMTTPPMAHITDNAYFNN